MAVKLNDLDNQSGNGLPGIMFANPDCGFVPYTVSFDKPTVIRPYGQPSPDYTHILPMWDDDGNLTDWLAVRNNIARGIYNPNRSDKRLTFDTSLPEHEASKYPDTPFNKIMEVVKGWEHSRERALDFGIYTKGSRAKSAPLTKAKRHGFIQCAMYDHSDKHFDPPRNNIVMMITTTCLYSLRRLLLEMRKENLDLFADGCERLALHFQDSGSHPILPAGYEIILEDPEGKPKDGNFKSHIARLVMLPKSVPVPTKEFNFSTYEEWDKVLRTLSAQEQVNILSETFDPQLIMDALRNTAFEPLIPEFVHNAVRASSQGMPYATTMQAPPPMTPAPTNAAPFVNPYKNAENKPTFGVAASMQDVTDDGESESADEPEVPVSAQPAAPGANISSALEKVRAAQAARRASQSNS